MSLEKICVFLFIVCLCTGCMNSLSNTHSFSNILTNSATEQQMCENPLRGIELDLAYIDILASTLRTNHLFLNMQLSAQTTWPEELDADTVTTEGYEDRLERELAENFSFFEYYGDMSYSDFFSFKKFADRSMIEAIQYTSLNLMHQRQVIKYENEEHEIPLCSELCDPLEEVILGNFVNGKGLSWITSPVGPNCLRRINAQGKLYANFEEAFVSLLDESLVREYEDAEKEYQDQVGMRCKLEMEQKDLELRLANLEESHGDAVEQRNIENELAALDIKIKKKDIQIDNALKVYEELLEKAQRMVVITPEKVKLAEKMHHVANAVSDNLSKAVVSIPTVMSKTVVDVLYLSRHMGQFPQIANVMAHEVKQKAQSENRDPMEIAQKRLELIGSRGVHFLPDLITISSAVYTQYNLYTPKKEYLAKLVEEGDGTIQASSWLF
jgi:hypothetical protein